jgi:hypothetical protein
MITSLAGESASIPRETFATHSDTEPIALAVSSNLSPAAPNSDSIRFVLGLSILLLTAESFVFGIAAKTKAAAADSAKT